MTLSRPRQSHLLAARWREQSTWDIPDKTAKRLAEAINERILIRYQSEE